MCMNIYYNKQICSFRDGMNRINKLLTYLCGMIFSRITRWIVFRDVTKEPKDFR